MTPCRCSHARRDHGLDRKQRPNCYGASMCGCTEYREAPHTEVPQTADIQDYLRQKGEIARDY